MTIASLGNFPTYSILAVDPVVCHAHGTFDADQARYQDKILTLTPGHAYATVLGDEALLNVLAAFVQFASYERKHIDWRSPQIREWIQTGSEKYHKALSHKSATPRDFSDTTLYVADRSGAFECSFTGTRNCFKAQSGSVREIPITNLLISYGGHLKTIVRDIPKEHVNQVIMNEFNRQDSEHRNANTLLPGPFVPRISSVILPRALDESHEERSPYRSVEEVWVGNIGSQANWKLVTDQTWKGWSPEF